MTPSPPTTAPRPVRIGVIGSADAGPEALTAARGVGRALARARAVVVCGGLGGVMAAAAGAAAAEGGLVLGFLPGEDPSAAAPGVGLPIATGFGEARNVLVVRASEAVLAVAGGWGTRNEAALCLKLGVPLIGLLDTLGGSFSIERFTDPDTAVARALEMATGRRRGQHTHGETT